MIKLTTPIFNSGLQIVLEGQHNNFMVYMLDTTHNKALNAKSYKDYNKALNNYKMRCTGL